MSDNIDISWWSDRSRPPPLAGFCHEFIVRDIDQEKISDTYLPGDILKDFVRDIIFQHPNSGTLLSELSNIVVFPAMEGSDRYARDGELKWSDVLNQQQMEKLTSQMRLILGYMLLSSDKENENIMYIEFFDTIIRGLNIGELMIKKYQSKHGITLVPKEIIDTSARYWAKVLGFIEDGVVKRRLIDDYIESVGIDRNKISWGELYRISETDPESEPDSDNESDPESE